MLLFVIQVSEIRFFPNEYKPSVSDAVDIAVVLLKENVTVSPDVLPACLGGPHGVEFFLKQSMSGVVSIGNR